MPFSPPESSVCLHHIPQILKLYADTRDTEKPLLSWGLTSGHERVQTDEHPVLIPVEDAEHPAKVGKPHF